MLGPSLLHAQNVTACGQQLSASSIYRGVPARSNSDQDQWSDNDCGTDISIPCAIGVDDSTNTCSYGDRYQCVEYVRRFYSLRQDTAQRVDTSGWIGLNAVNFITVNSSGNVSSPLSGFTAFANNGTTLPLPDDIIVFKGGGFGHVAVVMSVTSSNVNIIEQNWNTQGLYSLTISPSTNIVENRIGGDSTVFTVVGWLRATSNVQNNPMPVISQLSPSSLLLDAPAQTLTINGTGFIATSTATFNGAARPTTYISSTQVTIPLAATDLQLADIYPVVVVNLGPGGGASSAVDFSVDNPAPSISSLSPSSAMAGAAAQTLTINGTGFVSTSSVTFNGTTRAATFMNANQLTIQLSSSDLLNPGSYPVTVANPGPGGGSSSDSFTVESVTALKGKVLNGSQPIVSASVYLYAASTIGYQNASVSLLTSTSGTSKDSSGNYYVTTDSAGSFTIPSGYTCPSASSQVYLLAVGGNPGSGVNNAAGLLAALGSCANLSASATVVVNEVSTIATAYAIAGFATDATHVSSSGTSLAQIGVANAFATAANLETLSIGVALVTTPAGNGTVPQSKINTLANILAACINSSGSGSTTCTTLFGNAKNGSTTPTDTATAAINIAHNPGANVSTLYGLQAASALFQPMLSAAPNDFTVAVEIDYTGGGTTDSNSIAIDGSGNVWIADGYGSSIRKVNSTGAVLSGSSGYTGGGLNGPYWISVDATGNVWADNAYSLGNRLSKFSTNGNAISSSSGYTGGGLNGGFGVTIDSSGNVWSANNGEKSLSKFNSGGGAISGSSGYTGGGLNSPPDLAIDTSGNVWVVNSNNSISKFSSGGAAISGSLGYTGGGLSTGGFFTISPIAVDGSGSVWVANSQGNSLSKFSSSGSALSPSSGYTGGGLNQPNDIAIDGSGNVWTANIGNNSISKFNSSGTALSGSSGFTANGMSDPGYVAIDSSGNVWVGIYDGQRLFEFVGAATPVVTPTVANLLSPYGSSAVNKP
jgi:sugar lactone lactonase YvrE